MSGMPEFPGGMALDLRLCAESGGRLLRVDVRRAAGAAASAPNGTRGEEASVQRPKEVVPALLAAVEVGLFAGPKEGQRIQVVGTEAREAGGERFESWEWLTPPLELEALAVFARMIWSTGARALAIAQRAPEARLTVRAFDQAPARTDRTVPWELSGHLEDNFETAVILVSFRREAPEKVMREMHATLRAWGAVVALEGFTGGASSQRSAALFTEVGMKRRREMFARFDALRVGRDGWAALWAGLSRIHRQARIARVELR